MTIRTSTLAPKNVPDAAAPVTAPASTRAAPAVPGPRHGKPVPEPALRAAAQTAIEVAIDGGDTYRMLGLVSAMALEQRVSTADVLGAMKRVVDAWGHLAAPETIDLP